MKKEYNKNYYNNILEEKLQTYVYCECCNKSFRLWNSSAHNRTKKHLYNQMSEEEKVEYLKLKENEKNMKKIDSLKNRIQED